MQSAELFLDTSGLKHILEQIYVGCCREKPDKLCPYVVEFLSDNYAKSAKQSVAQRSNHDAGTWKPMKNFVPLNKLQLEQYLDDLGMRPLLERITEKAVRLRPSNVVALAVDVACGTDDTYMDESEARAAQALQARQRGNTARKEKKQQQAAATKVQASARGRRSRKQKGPSQPAIAEEGGAVAAAPSETVEISVGS
uniref:Uncharacterized protein n=1 Tax=Prymnesium polylepis TaxID=72548 RepID=A0A7S4JD67_9EUKA